MIVGRRDPDRAVGCGGGVAFETATQERDVARVQRADLTVFVNAEAAGAPGDLANFVRCEQAVGHAVEFLDGGEDQPADR